MPRLKHPRLSLMVLAACLIAVTALAARLGQRVPPDRMPSDQAEWREVAWHMPLDNWGEGLSWRAAGDLSLHVRTKTGFCNCFNGIADDAEIDRIGDVDLHGDDFAPAGPGVVTSIGPLAGRARLFRTRSKWSGTRHVLSIVVAEDCKAVVATLVSPAPIPAEAEASALALLRGDRFRQWAAAR